MDDPDSAHVAGGARALPSRDLRAREPDGVDVVLVTNVGQGYGRALALGFGRQGHDVVCADRDVALASRTAAEVEEAGGQAIPIQADMTTQMDVSNAFRKVHEIFGRLGGVVHVADHVSHTRLRELTESEYGELLDETLRSAFLVLRASARGLGDGWIVLVGPARDAAEPHVSAMRAALEGFVTSLAGGGRRVNLLVPSRGPSDPAHDARLVDAAVFLGSARAAGIDGQVVAVDLPAPPRVAETLLPEVRAALDASVTQEDLDSELAADLAESDDLGADADGASEDGADDDGEPRSR